MNLKIKQALLISCVFTITKSQECSQKNTSCKDIKAAGGYMFSHGGHKGSEIYVYHNKTVIAHWRPSTQSITLLRDSVISMDNQSVITKECQDLHIQCYVSDGTFVKEICLDYKITEDMKSTITYPTPTPWDLFIGVPVASVVALVGLILISCYVSWRKEKKKQHCAGAEFSFSRYLWTRCCFGKGISQAEPREEEIGMSAVPASVHVHSIDLTADGETPHSPSLSNAGMQPSKNGVATAPDVNRATNPRAMHRGLRDDPGGVNDDKGNDRIREKHNGWTHDRGPEDPESERLLWNERAAIQSFDMTGGAAVLVNKRGSDPDQVSRCSTAPDVESTQNMKKSTQVSY